MWIKIVDGIALLHDYEAWRAMIAELTNISMMLATGNGLTTADALRHPAFFSSVSPTPFTIDAQLVMEDLRARAEDGTLHLSCTVQGPPSFAEWTEISRFRDDVNSFRQDLKQYKPDESISLQRKSAALRTSCYQERQV